MGKTEKPTWSYQEAVNLLKKDIFYYTDNPSNIAWEAILDAEKKLEAAVLEILTAVIANADYSNDEIGWTAAAQQAERLLLEDMNGQAEIE